MILSYKPCFIGGYEMSIEKDCIGYHMECTTDQEHCGCCCNHEPMSGEYFETLADLKEAYLRQKESYEKDMEEA